MICSEFSVRLDGETASAVYDQIAERLASPEFRPRALFDRFKIELLATTDRATDSLDAHRAIRESGWGGRVVPTFRPDGVCRIAIAGLARRAGRAREGVGTRRSRISHRLSARSRSVGPSSSRSAPRRPTTAVVEPYTDSADARGRAILVCERNRWTATAADQRDVRGAHAVEMARISIEDGLVMQLHAGALRDHNRAVARRFGPDKGGDIPVATEYTRNLSPLLTRTATIRVSRCCCSRSTNRPTLASSRRWPDTIPRSALVRPGGSTIRSKA